MCCPMEDINASSVGAHGCVNLHSTGRFCLRSPQVKIPNLIVKMWSDSEIVLHWLHSTKPLKQFLANCTQEIKKLFPVTVWNHCPTHDNPADLLTRGINTTELQASSLWKHGPQWLPFEEQWPSWNHSKILHLDDTDTVTAKVNTTTDGATQRRPCGERTW